MIVALAAAILVAATPQSGDRLVDAFRAYVQAEGIGPVILPACAVRGTHAVCYGLVGSAGAMFGIVVSVEDVAAPVFVPQLMAPYGGSSASGVLPDQAPSHDELVSLAEDFLMQPDTAKALLSHNGMLKVSCDLPDPVEQGVPYRCQFSAVGVTRAAIDVTFDGNWVPHVGHTIYM